MKVHFLIEISFSGKRRDYELREILSFRHLERVRMTGSKNGIRSYFSIFYDNLLRLLPSHRTFPVSYDILYSIGEKHVDIFFEVLDFDSELIDPQFQHFVNEQSS